MESLALRQAKAILRAKRFGIVNFGWLTGYVSLALIFMLLIELGMQQYAALLSVIILASVLLEKGPEALANLNARV